MKHGNSFLYLLGNVLATGEYFLSKLVLMVLLVVSKLALWSRVTPKTNLYYSDTFSSVEKMNFVHLFIAMTTLQRWLFINWMIKMSFLMGTRKKKFIWSNLPTVLLRGSLLDWHVISANPYMVSSSLIRMDLKKFSNVVKKIWYNSQ